MPTTGRSDDVELRHLRYFIAVAEESTFIAASARLHLAQPALTRQIHDLEREIGVDLLSRGPRGTRLTPAGEVCLVSARHILKQLDHALEQARGSSRGAAGRCVMCCGTRSLTSGLIARIVARLQAEYPHIDLEVVEAVGKKQWNALQKLEVDIGLGAPMPAGYPMLVSEVFDHDVFDAIVIARDHPLATRDVIHLDDLRNETLLALQPSNVSEFDRLLTAEMKRVGFRPQQRRDFEEVVSLAAMVSAGQGFAFIGTQMPGIATSDMAMIPLADFRIPMAHAMMYRAADRRPVIRTVLDVIRRLAAEDRKAAGRAPIAVPAGPREVSVEVEEEETSAALSIELRHLRYYTAVVDAQSFGRAAERLELTQPALSRQIRDLERAVGVQLLERAARGATPTAAGESFHRSARSILAEASSLSAEAHRAERGVRARCLVGAVPTPDARFLITEILRRCALECPDTELSFAELATAEQPAALRAARIDLGVCNGSPLTLVEARGIRRDRLLEDSLNCALVSADSPLASRSSIDVNELRDLPFLFMRRAFQPVLYDQVFAEFTRHAFQPTINNTYEGLKTVWTLVAEGRGWGVAFESQCADPPAGTVAVHLDGLSIPWGLDVLTRADESRTSILLVLDMLHEITQGHPRQTTRV